MDLFYRPPLQRHDECGSLEQNYMNCLFQKALKDRVFTNFCNLDSVLWFHLECPKFAAKFDEPEEFKAKFRDYFSEMRMKKREDPENSQFEQMRRHQFDHVRYPEDVRLIKKVKEFQEDFNEHRPDHHFERDEDMDELMKDYAEERHRLNPTLKEMHLQKQEWLENREDITQDHSRREQ